jgi:hypothetical protein
MIKLHRQVEELSYQLIEMKKKKIKGLSGELSQIYGYF